MLKRIRKILFWSGLALLVWLVLVAARISSFGNTDHARAADAIIVLGAAAYYDNPSPVFEERLRHAVELHGRGLAPKLIFTGGFGEGATYAESEVGAKYAIAAGVPEADLLLEKKSRTTWGNLVEAKALMATHGIGSAIIVSDPLHLKRAAAMADDLDLDTVTSPTPTTRYRSFGAKAEFLAREVVFLHGYHLFGG